VHIYYFRKPSGKEPVREFIDSLPDHDIARIFFDLDLIRKRGLKDCGLSLRHIEGKLWEVRFKLSAGYRIFYCCISEQLCLLHAYKKQSTKAPEKEIEIARKRMREVMQ
jgi:phage-related protein